jgi:drug/metabolite transporter (DMT)-like permease
MAAAHTSAEIGPSLSLNRHRRLDFRGSAAELLGAGAVLVSALGYAGAALLYRRWLADAPAVGVTALMTAMCSAVFVAPVAVNLPRQVPPATSVLALVVLGIVNTGLAYWLFYLLIDEAGAATASVITYVMPVVALLLGASLLGEKLTIGVLAGLILIALGAWLATGRRQSAPVVKGSRTAATSARQHHSPAAVGRSSSPDDHRGR